MSYNERFAGIARLYGITGQQKLHNAHITIIGLGGVGSWSVECLARSGVGHLCVIDLDDVSESNINRQLHALSTTIGLNKAVALAERCKLINPTLTIDVREDFAVPDNLDEIIPDQTNVIIDAVDAVAAKAAIIHFAKRSKIKVITTGGAGGQRDPLKITKGDLAKTTQDPLAAKVRSELRRKYNFSKNPKRRFGVECIYSKEQLTFPTVDGGTSQEKQQLQGSGKMDCATGYGAFVGVTATFGMVAASSAIDYLTREK
ncbi:MAG: tRNA threonylcarbamoyladenosine dehydratase [Pseudomonadota bacterium]